MEVEITTLEQNDIWTIMDLLPGKKAIRSKWVYKLKLRANGTINRYKARLVAKGYTQVEGHDYHDTYAPIAKQVTLRCILALGVIKCWELHPLDVTNAILHGDLANKIYMNLSSKDSHAR
ncbi:PREDICTED: uncharacterized protein LOC109114747 [Nelumbo nucifera]|uniref:Uncharacterized protein LOC109114747 n=1 Tax=Nelumbo nucifera TaxID=4432 RepID=A0A1U8Q3N3_NELNU|nr:PREDICTED: uncharacterized protein LOC109114747 [Nelumbo nucifera]